MSSWQGTAFHMAYLVVWCCRRSQIAREVTYHNNSSRSLLYLAAGQLTDHLIDNHRLELLFYTAVKFLFLHDAYFYIGKVRACPLFICRVSTELCGRQLSCIFETNNSRRWRNLFKSQPAWKSIWQPRTASALITSDCSLFELRCAWLQRVGLICKYEHSVIENVK